MKNKISNLLITGLLSFSARAFANTDKVGEKLINLKDRQGQVMVITKKTEAKLGRPYTIELRVNCKGSRIAWEALPVSDSESVCDVKPQSAKLTADGKNIAILIRETDAEDFNQQSKVKTPGAMGEMQPKCQKASKEFLFPIESYCTQ